MIEKPIEWMGDSYNVLCAFPAQARRDAGFQLNSVQHAFQKKTQRTPKKNIDLAKQRLRDVQHMRRDK